jgi:hypothetical protein
MLKLSCSKFSARQCVTHSSKVGDTSPLAKWLTHHGPSLFTLLLMPCISPLFFAVIRPSFNMTNNRSMLGKSPQTENSLLNPSLSSFSKRIRVMMPTLRVLIQFPGYHSFLTPHVIRFVCFTELTTPLTLSRQDWR